MTTRIEMLERSLANKIEKLGRMSAEHIEDARNANGQPLNDKRNGAATIQRWDRQRAVIAAQLKEIEKTEEAIEDEQELLNEIAAWRNF